MAEVTGSYDLVVIGGGIHGLCIAERGASRGWRTLLLEKGPRLAGATTANWFRILHGGLRYLQSADLTRHRESVVAILERHATMDYPENKGFDQYGDQFGFHCVIDSVGHGGICDGFGQHLFQ